MTVTLKFMAILMMIAVVLVSGCGDNTTPRGEITSIVIYDENGATGGSVPLDSDAYAEGETVTVLSNSGDLLRTGYTFIGWNTESDGSGDTFNERQTFAMDSEDVVLFALWTANPTWTVTYHGNGATDGSVPATSVNYEEGQTISVLGNTGSLEQTGYTFNGWNTSSDGSGTSYYVGNTLSMGTENIILYASWTEVIPTEGETIADHTIAKESVLRRIPESALTAARNTLHILYCGTSHSTQVMTGMKGLEQYKDGDDTRFAFSYNGVPVAGKLDIHYNGASGTDLSNDGVDENGHTAYFRGTVAYLDNGSYADVNVVMWSWCSIEGHNVQTYLSNFDELSTMYRAGGSKGRTSDNAVTFVWMTGYARGSDGDDPDAAHSPYNNHKAIVDHCRANGYFCLDYWSQDVYDYGDDSYNPYESGNDNVQHYNYQNSEDIIEGVDWFPCRNWTSGDIVYPAHTNEGSHPQYITGNRRAYAAWWIWARIAGWDGSF